MKEQEKETTALVKISEQELRKKYDTSKYHMLVPFEGEITLSPLIKMEEVRVHIDKHEIHNIHGKYQPNADSTRRLLEAGSIDIFDTETNRVGDYIWKSVVWGKKRNPDGTFRKAQGEYEFDANVRGEELRLSMKDKSETEIQKEILKLKKFGAQRANTGATLRMIRAITGLPTSFDNPKELEKSFVLYRFVINTEALLADPETRKILIDRAVNSSEEIYGDKESKQLAHEETADYQVENNGAQKEEGKDKVPWKAESEEDKEKQQFDEMLNELKAKSEKYKNDLPDDAKDIINETTAKADKGELDFKTLSSTLDRLNDWEDRYKSSLKEASHAEH